MTEYPTVSIVIITLGAKAFIKYLLDSLLKTDYPNFEIILIDNDSKDGTRKILSQYKKKVKNMKVILKDHIDSYAKNNNDGVSASIGKYVVLANDDLKFPYKDWLKRLVEVMEANTRIGGANPLILDWEGKEAQTLGLVATPIPPIRIHIVPKHITNMSRSKLVELWSLYGALMIFRRDIYQRSGGMDEDYSPMLGEEPDLTWRMKLLGYRMLGVTGSKVCHYLSATQSKFSHEKFLWGLKHSVDSSIKNLSLLWLLTRLPLFLVFQLINSRLVGFSSSYVVKSLTWNIRRLPHILVKRRVVQRSRKIKDNECFKPLAPFSMLLAVVRKYYFS
jgi:hypothetical protein